MKMENENQIQRDNTETSLSKLASSQYKMQLGINSCRDELKTIADSLVRIAEALEKK
jgi:hypothetical protein